MASLKKKIIVKTTQKISAQKSKPKKADDFTVNTETGKRTLSGAEASRRKEQNLKNLKAGRIYAPRSLNEEGQYYLKSIKGSKLPVSSGGRRATSSFAFEQKYNPAGNRTKKERGR